jgi:uncharacterized membrane protein YfcA
MELLGYIASVLIGISLGLIGSGGSILTVPVLVYLFGVEPVFATAYSLFIVGSTAAVGSIGYLRKGLVDIRTALVFGAPSILAVFIARAYVVPAIPKEVVAISGFMITRNLLMMVLFAVLMVAASFSMIKKSGPADESNAQRDFNYPVIVIEGLVVGLITGLVGAGGGFLIIPALVLLSKLPMKQAVGTSLVIIAAKSLIGFLGEHQLSATNWSLVLSVTTVACFGIFFGLFLSKKIDGAKLKPVFGWFVLVMGIYIIMKETLFNH